MRVVTIPSKGRLELEMVESDRVDPAGAGVLKGDAGVLHGAAAAAERGWMRLQVRPYWAPPRDIEVPGYTREGHGGADARMTAELFGPDPGPDPPYPRTPIDTGARDTARAV